MQDKYISRISPIEKKASITIELTDYCNFSCKYCITGKKFTGKGLVESSIDKIINLIQKTKEIYNEVEVVISGGEPTINNIFFNLLNLLLDLPENILVRINTNGFILHKKSDELMKLGSLPNRKNLFFNITFHYFEYEKKVDIFIESIKALKGGNIKFGINFLLPDTICMADFLNVRNRIIDESHLFDLEFDYSLIKSTDGTISKFYSEEMLDFFSQNGVSNKSQYDLDILYSSDEKERINSSELLYRGLNNFSGFKCHYIDPDHVNIYINPNLTCYFGSCYTLNRLKFSIDETIALINKGNMFTLCGDHSCLCESDFFTPKEYNEHSIKIRKIVTDLLMAIKPGVFGLHDVIISQGNSVQIICTYKNTYIYVVIEKIVDTTINYPYSNNGLGYHFFLRNEYNEFIIDSQDISPSVEVFLSRIFSLKSIFQKIIQASN